MSRPHPLVTDPSLPWWGLTGYVLLVLAFAAAIAYVGWKSWKDTRDE
jgi:predicted negative regulator of RcsB-dependent stress response